MKNGQKITIYALVLIINFYSQNSFSAHFHNDTDPTDWPQKAIFLPPQADDLTEEILTFPDISYKCGWFNKNCDLDDFLKNCPVTTLYAVHKDKKYYLPIKDKKNPTTSPKELLKKPNRIASITKSLNSALLGKILFSDSNTNQINIKIPAKEMLIRNDVKFSVDATLLDILHMKSGINWNNSKEESKGTLRLSNKNCNKLGDCDLKRLANKITSDTSINDKKPFNYSNLDSLLLGFIVESELENNEGLKHKTLADAFNSLILKEVEPRNKVRWKADRNHHNPGFCCSYFSAQDLARFGEWFLEKYQQGSSESKTNFEKYAYDSINNTVETGISCKYKKFNINYKYGYQWWILGEDNGFAAIGKGGQILHIMPEYDLVIVQFSNIKTKNTTGSLCESFYVHKLIAEQLEGDI